MAFGKRSEAWDHTALLAKEIHNDPEGHRERLQIQDFHPLAELPETQTDNPIKINDPALLTKILGGTTSVVK